MNVVPAARLLDGVNVATVSPLLKLVDPATEFPLESFTVNDTELGTTASENVTVGAVETGLLDDPDTGVDPVTVGATPDPPDVLNTTSTQKFELW